MTDYPHCSFECYGDAAGMVNLLTKEDRARLQDLVNWHEQPLDCSDGPCIALAADAEEMKSAHHTCCGWQETRAEIGGTEIVIGSCYGH